MALVSHPSGVPQMYNNGKEQEPLPNNKPGSSGSGGSSSSDVVSSLSGSSGSTADNIHHHRDYTNCNNGHVSISGTLFYFIDKLFTSKYTIITVFYF